MENLIRKYDGVGIQDDGVSNSAQAKQFYKDFKAAVKRSGDIKLVNASAGHYSYSGFASVAPKAEYPNLVYFTFSIPRCGLPMEMENKSPMNGILIRVCKDTDDYRGRENHFTSFKDFEKDVKKLAKYGK